MVPNALMVLPITHVNVEQVTLEDFVKSILMIVPHILVKMEVK